MDVPLLGKQGCDALYDELSYACFLSKKSFIMACGGNSRLTINTSTMLLFLHFAILLI